MNLGEILKIVSEFIVPVGFIIVWTRLFVRLFLKHVPILPRQNRLRRAPWSGAVCLLIFGMCSLLPSAMMTSLIHTMPQKAQLEFQETTHPHSLNSPSESPSELHSNSVQKTDSQSVSENEDASVSEEEQVSVAKEKSSVSEEKQSHHQIFEFLSNHPSSKKFGFVFLYAVLLGPFFEEFVFRLVFQGWLDAREREIFRGRKGNGWRSVILTAILFALMHFREASASYPSEFVLWTIFGVTLCAIFITLTAGISIFRFGLHLRWKEFGFDFSHWKSDILLGFSAFFAVALPTYMLQLFLNRYMGDRVAPDFITLLPVAFVFGVLYWRTKRILPGFVAHAVFNAFSLFQVFLIWFQISA